MAEALTCSVTDHVARIHVERPSQANSWTMSMLVGAAKFVDAACQTQELAGVVVEAAGSSVFSGGADLKELASIANDQAKVKAFLDAVETFLRTLEEAPCPVIVAVNGAAVGLGTEIAAAADVRLAAAGAKFSIPAATLGIVITRTDVARLARALGYSTATDMLLTGREVSAPNALSIGFVSLVLEPPALSAAVRELCFRLAAMPRASIRDMKGHLRAVAATPHWDEAAYGPSLSSWHRIHAEPHAGT